MEARVNNTRPEPRANKDADAKGASTVSSKYKPRQPPRIEVPYEKAERYLAKHWAENRGRMVTAHISPRML
jgi:hypothetical protein